MDLEELLQKFNFDKKEARVYLALLKLGSDTAYEIAKSSGLKRPTVYFVLDKLIKRGVVSTKQAKKATRYAPLSPKRLRSRLASNLTAFETAMPQLISLHESQSEKPKVQVFEGIEGVRHVYYEVANEFKRHREVLYFGSTKHFLDRSPYDEMLDEYVKALSDGRHKAREILVRDELQGSKYLAKVAASKNQNHQIRFFPNYISFEDNDNLIYSSKVAIFSVQERAFVVLIDSKNISNSYKNLFEFMWQSAEK